MITKNLPAMLTLAVLTAASFSATVVAQQTRISSTGFSKITVRKTEVPKRVPQAARNVTVSEANTIMAQYKQWMIGANKTGLVVPKLTWSGPADRNYNLKGSVPRKFLQYEKQGTFGGINLGWTDNASANTAIKSSQWFVRRPFGMYYDEGGANAVPIKYGERIAIAWGSRSKPFIRYRKRNIGINLNWSSKPYYEWAILGGTPGTNVRRGQDYVILYNLKHKRPLMYFDRTKGGHIGWPGSRKWGTGTISNPQHIADMGAAVKVLLSPEAGTWTFPK